jgi:hypothetical protein
MATSSTLITTTQMANDINTIPQNRRSRVVWTNTNFPPDCGSRFSATVGDYGAGEFGSSGNIIVASTIVSKYREMAKRQTRYQLLSSYRTKTGCGGVGDIYYGNNLSTLSENSTYNSQIDNAAAPGAGTILTADSINNFVTTINNLANQSTGLQNFCNTSYCHCSCHSSCHGSRARR